MTNIEKLKIKEYLESWLDNVGRLESDEETLAAALLDTQSMREWGIHEIDYDYNFAISIISGGSK